MNCGVVRVSFKLIPSSINFLLYYTSQYSYSNVEKENSTSSLNVRRKIEKEGMRKNHNMCVKERRGGTIVESKKGEQDSIVQRRRQDGGTKDRRTNR